jgi:hypothetical protein
MYIKRIVIEGFKTYKDRVEIELDPGLTIIGTLECSMFTFDLFLKNLNLLLEFSSQPVRTVLESRIFMKVRSNFCYVCN